MWRVFEEAKSPEIRGPDDRATVLDEEHSNGARITLERDATGAHWQITCSLYRVFNHSAKATSNSEALQKYADMKRDLESIMAEDPSTPCYEKIRLFTDRY